MHGGNRHSWSYVVTWTHFSSTSTWRFETQRRSGLPSKQDSNTTKNSSCLNVAMNGSTYESWTSCQCGISTASCSGSWHNSKCVVKASKMTNWLRSPCLRFLLPLQSLHNNTVTCVSRPTPCLCPTCWWQKNNKSSGSTMPKHAQYEKSMPPKPSF